MEPIFEGTGVALVLPMFEDGSIDYEGYKRQVQRMIDGGVKALLVNGTTGEPATIDIEDEFDVSVENPEEIVTVKDAVDFVESHK